MYFVNLLLGIIPNSSGQGFKTKLLRWAGVKVGKDVEIFQGFKIHGVGEVTIGDRVFLGHESMILVNEGSHVILDDDTGLGTRSMIVTGFHPITPDGDRLISREGTSSTVHFCKGSGTAAYCVILPGVTLGEMSYVSASTTISKDVKPYSIVGCHAPKTYITETMLKKMSKFSL